jgi:hypothetical protein
VGVRRALYAICGRESAPHRLGLHETAVREPEPARTRQVHDPLALVVLTVLAPVEHARRERPGMGGGGEHGVERRAQVRLEVLSGSAARHEHEVLPVGEGHGGHGLLTPQPIEFVGKTAQAGERDMQRQRVLLRTRPLTAPQQVRKLPPDAFERQRTTRSAPQQRVDRDPLDPRLVQHVTAAHTLEERIGGHETDDRSRGRAADGVHPQVHPVLIAHVLERDEQRRGGARLVGAEGGPARQGEGHAEGFGHARFMPTRHIRYTRREGISIGR